MKILSDRINDYTQFSPKTKGKDAKSNNTIKEDRVEISNQAKELLVNEGELEQKMGEKVKKIFSLKRSIENTEYKVDLDKVADKILEDFGIVV